MMETSRTFLDAVKALVDDFPTDSSNGLLQVEFEQLLAEAGVCFCVVFPMVCSHKCCRAATSYVTAVCHSHGSMSQQYVTVMAVCHSHSSMSQQYVTAVCHSSMSRRAATNASERILKSRFTYLEPQINKTHLTVICRLFDGYLPVI